tara:strand:+ start:763 stop:1425 length:663 start_codon:yes stop_codon:yes gene_type:complete
MAFTPEQAAQVKQQLFQQIEGSQLPNKDEIRQQIEAMNEEQLEEFIKQQQEAAGQQQGAEGQQPSEQGPQCIFCSITKGETPSHKIAENNKSIAILEINPLSKGHSIILPLEHISVEELPKSALSLAQKVAKRIKTKLKPAEVKIETSAFQGHAMVNIIPIYSDKQLEKYQAPEQELKEIQNILETKKRAPRTTKSAATSKTTTTKKSSSGIIKLNRRVP